MQTTPFFSRRTFLIAATMLATVACSDEHGNPSVRGDYSLRTVNGAALPYVTTSTDGVKTEVLDDVISIFSGNTFSELSHLRITANGQTTTQAITETGTYGGLGTGLLFSYNSGKPARQSVLNSYTLSFLENGVSRIYIKPN